MVRSLLIKLAMLAVTLGALVWIGSVTPVRQVTPHQIQAAAAAPIATVSRPQTNVPSKLNLPADALSVAPEISGPHAAPPVDESAPPASSGSTRAASPDPSRRVDLNHATASDLEALPGIGPKLAQRVIEHRTSHGPFTKVEDLRQVKGIGHKKFDRLRPHVLVTNARSPSRHKGTL
ncbi:MAG: helix-hairpin-helix domain-containing protein [Nitrospira defluvii]|nr:helix-hairpin-helix domain-containing protein [Nitrospira defluvii]